MGKFALQGIFLYILLVKACIVPESFFFLGKLNLISVFNFSSLMLNRAARGKLFDPEEKAE
jgi:hypothetical protein